MDNKEKLKLELEFEDDNKYYDDTDYITNSMLSLLNKSPQHLEMHFLGHRQESPALNFGKAFHTFVLEPEKWKDEVAVFTGKSKRGKDWTQFQEDNNSKTIISQSELQKITGMRRRLCAPPVTWEFIENSDHEVVSVFEWDDSGILCKGKVDCLYTDENGRRILIDVKTTQDASPTAFKRSAYKYGYHRQASFYKEGFNADEFWFAVIEKDSPYRTGLYKCSDEFLQNGRVEINNLMVLYRDYFIDEIYDVNDFHFNSEI